jgi:hypothetical protein
MSENRPGHRSVIISMLALILYSCEFEPHKVYQRTAEENVSAPEIQVVELNLNYDTIFLYTQKQIHFSFVSSNQAILAVRFTIDDTEKYLVNSNSGVFNLDYRMFTNGIHTMVLEVYTASGSGSIAEHMGMEGFIFSKSWVLYIDQNNSYNVKSTISDGFLKLYWNRYRGYDFKEYVIYRTGWGTDMELARLKSGFFIDSSYVGETARYGVEVVTVTGTNILWGNLELQKDLPRLQFTVSENNEYRVIWNKPKYYAAVDTIRLAQSNNYGINSNTTYATHNTDDTTHILTSAFFGDDIELTLRLEPKNNIGYIPDYYSLFQVVLDYITVGFPFGTRKKSIFDVNQVDKDEFIYIAGCDSLVRYSVSGKRIVEKLGYEPIGCSMCNFISIAVSPSGRFLTTSVDCNRDAMLANSRNLGSHAIRDLKSLTGNLYGPELPVSDAGRILVKNGSGGFYLYDFNADSTIGFYYKDIYYTTEPLAISLNGDYILLRHDSLRLVHFNDLQFIDIWSHSRFPEPDFYEFDGNEPERMVIRNGDLFSVKKCSDFSTVREFSINDTEIMDIDYYNNKLLTWSTGNLYVRSFEDGSLLYTIPFRHDPSFWYNYCFLVDNAIVCMKGVIYFVGDL